MTEKNKTQEIITEASSQGLTVKQRVQIGNRRSVKRRQELCSAAGLFRGAFRADVLHRQHRIKLRRFGKIPRRHA